MAKKKYTLTLDEELVKEVRTKRDNLSATVTEALEQLMALEESSRIYQSLKTYDLEVQERRKKYGLFSDKSRKFL